MARYECAAIDLPICPDCGGRLRVIADVTRPDIIQKILEHVARQQAPPEFRAMAVQAASSFGIENPKTYLLNPDAVRYIDNPLAQPG